MRRAWLVRVARIAAIVVPAMAMASLALAQPPAARVGAAVVDALTATGQARVLITLRDPAPLTAAPHVRGPAVSSVQDAVLAGIPAADLTVTHRYQSVPGLAGVLTRAALDVLRADPNVVAIETDEPVSGHLRVSVPALRADVVHTVFGITGDGVRVAVVDSGVDLKDPELSVVAQQCFAQNACQPGNTNRGSNAQDDHGHGTNVASIVAADGSVYAPGFAPRASVVAVKVLDSKNAGFVSDTIAGLDWIRTNLATLRVRVINTSIGTNTLFPGPCDAQQTLYSSVVGQLTALGVAIFASTGNAGSSTSISAPSCLNGVVAVGATYKANVGRQPPSGTFDKFINPEFPACADTTTSLQTVTCFTNSNARLDVFAPGAPITTYGLGGGLVTFYGTSQASPTAAGVAALMLEANPNLTPAQILSRLKLSGPNVTDPKNGLQRPRIDALNAVQLATGLAAVTDVNGESFSVGQTVSITAGLINPGLLGSADVYVGLVRPDGSVLFFTPSIVVGNVANVRSFRPIAAGVPLSAPFSVTVPKFFEHQWTSADPKGTYLFFVGAVVAGALSGGTLPPNSVLGFLGNSFSLQ